MSLITAKVPRTSHSSTEELQLQTSERHGPASQCTPHKPRTAGGHRDRGPQVGPSTTVGHHVRLCGPRAFRSPVWPPSAPELLRNHVKPDAPLAESLEEEARRLQTRKGARPAPIQHGQGQPGHGSRRATGPAEARDTGGGPGPSVAVCPGHCWVLDDDPEGTSRAAADPLGAHPGAW